MKTFYLKPKNSSEVIKSGRFEDKTEAVIFFSEIKQLSEEELLKIFVVSEEKE